MRHQKKHLQLMTDASHRDAVLAGLAMEIIRHEKIRTTARRAKATRPVIEHLITLGKRGDVHARRQAMAVVGDKELVHKLFDEIAARYADREGGYTRVLKLGPRPGDAAPMAIIELV
jgi:large subunit ribosomal protein L17